MWWSQDLWSTVQNRPRHALIRALASTSIGHGQSHAGGVPLLIIDAHNEMDGPPHHPQYCPSTRAAPPHPMTDGSPERCNPALPSLIPTAHWRYAMRRLEWTIRGCTYPSRWCRCCCPYRREDPRRRSGVGEKLWCDSPWSRGSEAMAPLGRPNDSPKPSTVVKSLLWVLVFGWQPN
jgi:hypothetical protein